MKADGKLEDSKNEFPFHFSNLRNGKCHVELFIYVNFMLQTNKGFGEERKETFVNDSKAKVKSRY